MSTKQILRSEDILQKYGESLAGKTVLITGVSNESIAGELAIQLASASPNLLILSARAESKVKSVIDQIKERNVNVQTLFLDMDLSDLSSVRKAAQDGLADVPKIDHVICVAGVMMCPYGKTADGFETQLGVNYLSNFLLIKILLPKVEAAGPSSSIIVVSSSSVRTGKIHFDDIGFSEGKTYDAYAAYGQSNVARTMFAKKLAEKLKGKGIRIFSIDPGAVQSGLQRHFTEDFQAQVSEMMKAGYLIDMDGTKFDFPPWTGRSEGAANIVTGMIDPTIAGFNGSFISQNAIADDDLHSHIRDEENWTRLWDMSEEMVGVKY
ncbi:uncharacterized protein N7469_001426 [Penicillium citrinum]|uniref:Uncharacterized protein n=1 Tax=Penicillium citrinum TaxID=5077 RepID=A0A9W9TWB6_PENCI|nr:uncharacterized protein N7469_001426 [Penicillium citrinum]KAJ5243099.1 hypothetical protein N7469_001426 [Penicillium citrinum]